MRPSHVVVDGSNIATEGRASPSLRQLDEAVRQFQEQHPGVEVVVVVDATFGHRIPPAERKAFEEAVSHGELVSPPAGAIGRGDAFVLRIAERVGGQVLSNDSFQEFHAEHPWLFEEGRLIGGKPVPGVGWIFTPRRPVRGPRSQAASSRGRKRTVSASSETARVASATTGTDGAVETGRAADAGGRRPKDGEPAAARPSRGRSALLAAVEAAAAEATEAATARAEPEAVPPLEAVGVLSEGGEGTATTGTSDRIATPSKRSTTSGAARRRRRRRAAGDPRVQAAIEAATKEAVGAEGGGEAAEEGSRTRRRRAEGPRAVNDPLTFLTFISEHPIGDEVTGVVANFVSHGAMVDVGPMHCYVPLSGLGDPPPNSARAVLRKGETRTFVLVALDPPRRGAQLALARPASQQAGAEGAHRPTRAKVTAKAAKAPAEPTKAPAGQAKATKAEAATRAATKAKAAKAKATKAEAPKAKGTKGTKATATKATKSTATKSKAAVATSAARRDGG